MSDPAIKLFGKTIPLQESKADSSSKEDHVPDAPPLSSSPSCCCDNKDSQQCLNYDDPAADNHDDHSNPTTSSPYVPDLKEEEKGKEDATPDVNKLCEQSKSSTASEEDHNEAEGETADGKNEKVLKKPDKILPCPRCNSLDTKFCYYNNYNVNQPRHFCKNCQRYWTAGGTMRNVPVGAGRRKNKHSASHYRHIMLPDGMAASARVDTADATHNQVIPCSLPTTPGALKTNGTVLKFGSEAPLFESMANVLNLAEHAMVKRNVDMRAAACGGDNHEEVSCGSSTMTPVCKENGLLNMVNSEHGGNTGCSKGGHPAPLPQCYAGTPWPYGPFPCNPGWNGVAPVAAGNCSSKVLYDSGSVQWSSPPTIVPGPAFCAPALPFPFVPASYWGCMPGWTGGAWSVPWMGSAPGLSPSSTTTNSNCPGNGSPTLGKHSRDTSAYDHDKPERCVWVPKTLRIDDPDEAAKSSIWATLGIKHESGDAVARGILKAFQPKTETKGHVPDASMVLHANPAALSRSQTFQEST